MERFPLQLGVVLVFFVFFRFFVLPLIFLVSPENINIAITYHNRIWNVKWRIYNYINIHFYSSCHTHLELLVIPHQKNNEIIRNKWSRIWIWRHVTKVGKSNGKQSDSVSIGNMKACLLIWNWCGSRKCIGLGYATVKFWCWLAG